MRFIIKPKPERILCTDILIAAMNPNRNYLAGRIVDLECGHKAFTKASRRMVCPRCAEMLRRSIEDGSEDYESFRKGIARDNMEWKKDPCYRFNERK